MVPPLSVWGHLRTGAAAANLDNPAYPAMTAATTLWTASASGGVPFPIGEQHFLHGSDQRGSERADIGIRRDAAQFALGGEVGGDHGRSFRQDRDAGRRGPAEPGTQVIPRGDKADDRHRDRPEQLRQGAREVVRDGAGPGGVAQGGGLAAAAAPNTI